ncbi:eukaryotic aspartyl protease, partial [Ancylostoma duodenale]
ACLVFCPKRNQCCFGRRHKRDTYPCRGRRVYDPRDSKTFEETKEDFDAQFGEFEASGIYSKETVVFGEDRTKHLVANGIKFGRAKQAYGFHPSPMDGVLGLGFVDPIEEDYVPALLQAAKLGLVKPIFTIFLKHVEAEVDVHGGVLTLGGIDDVHCDKNVEYVKLSGISIKNFSLKKKEQADSDTKDPFITTPAAVSDAIAKEAGAEYNATDDLYDIDCSAKPVIELRIENKTYTIESTLKHSGGGAQHLGRWWIA